MDLFALLETFGVPVAMSVAFGFFIWKQNSWIQNTLMMEMEESQNRLESILVKLIDAQKKMQVDGFGDLHKELARLTGSYQSLVKIITKLSEKRIL
tara:strand:+ start:11040 stop:11327 length:288 start_codon:yes stop_codon:yes gene_type:complete